MTNEENLNQLNSEYWEELCGTNIARKLGVSDSSLESLSRFDRWFFDFYPYLDAHLESVVGLDGPVLEVGLGYGSVATRLMEKGVNYKGLDIARGPVDMANHRALLLGHKRVADIGNVLDMTSVADGHFVGSVAIGSLHHTGNFRAAIKELVRVTSPDGIVVGMVYSIFSLRNWIKRPRLTLKLLFKNLRTHGVSIRADEHLRWMSDHNSSGEAAPATEYFSRRALKKILSDYGEVSINARNLDQLPIPFLSSERVRLWLIKTPLAAFGGLDLYFSIRVAAKQVG